MRVTMRKLFAVLAVAAIAAAATGPVGTAAGGAPTVNLNGAGASFPFPLYSKWVYEYNKLHPQVRINYQSIGSGGGIRQISEGTVDFAGSDAVMTDEALAKLRGPLLHIPTTIGAVAVTYNLAGAPAGLKLTPEALSGIFLGEILKWNDSKIASANPGVSLPAAAINVVRRSDGSGTTAVFTDYLSAVSPGWAKKVGRGTAVSWPVGLGAKGNEGVAGQVKATPGAIGYVELAYAAQIGLPCAALGNRAGRFVEPAAAGIAAAAAAVPMPDDFRVSLVNAPGEAAYPIAAFTWVLLYRHQPDRTKGEALVEFLRWAVRDGQEYGPTLHYVPLPEGVVTKVEVALGTIAVGGKPAPGK